MTAVLLIVGALSWLGLTDLLMGRLPWEGLPARWKHAHLGDVYWVLPSPEARCRRAERCVCLYTCLCASTPADTSVYLECKLHLERTSTRFQVSRDDMNLQLACRDRQPVALCGVARLVSSTVRIAANPFEPELPTHANMLEMISTTHPGTDFTDDFDEILPEPAPEAEDGKLVDIRPNRIIEDTDIYDNLVSTQLWTLHAAFVLT